MRRGGVSEAASRASGVPTGGTAIGSAAGAGAGAVRGGRGTLRWRALRLVALPARRAMDTSLIISGDGMPRSGRGPRDVYHTADPMADLNRLLLDNLALVIGVLAALVAVLLVAVLVQSARLGRATRAYREIARDVEGASLHDLLAGNASAVERAAERMSDIEGMHGLIDERTRRSLQHIGMVRFNPFEDTGSDQSFAIALLDDRRDGVVISSLHGRANTRLFAKPVTDGASTHNLSDEEARAIRIAVEGTRPK